MEERKRPAPIRDFQATDLGQGIYSIIAPPMGFYQYLVVGAEKALLIDTGFGVGSLKRVVEGLTHLPILLLNTHAHPDHVGGNAEFGAPLLHRADWSLYTEKGGCVQCRAAEAAERWHMAELVKTLQPTPLPPIAVEDGQKIDLGQRTLTVLHTPGHTAGSICVFDEKTGSLFSGDNVQPMTALTERWAAPVSDYLASLKRLQALPIGAIYTGHRPGCVPPETIARQMECAQAILSGEQGEPFSSPMGSGWTVTRGNSGIRYAQGKNC